MTNAEKVLRNRKNRDEIAQNTQKSNFARPEGIAIPKLNFGADKQSALNLSNINHSINDQRKLGLEKNLPPKNISDQRNDSGE